MLATLAVIIPLGLGGAVSPVMLTEQTVLLAGPNGATAGLRYAAGVVLTTSVIVVAIERFGRAISLPTKPHLDATLDLVLGLVLVNVAVLVVVSGRRRSGSPSRRGGGDRGANGSRQARAAFAFGVFAMATNFTTLALLAPTMPPQSASAGHRPAGSSRLRAQGKPAWWVVPQSIALCSGEPRVSRPRVCHRRIESDVDRLRRACVRDAHREHNGGTRRVQRLDRAHEISSLAGTS